MVAFAAISDTLTTIYSVAREWKAQEREFATTFTAARPEPITLDEMLEFSHAAIVALSDRTRHTVRNASMFGHAVLRPHRRPQLFSNHSIASRGEVTTDYIIGRPGWSADWTSGVRAEKNKGFIPSQFAITSGFKNDESIVHHGMVEVPLLDNTLFDFLWYFAGRAPSSPMYYRDSPFYYPSTATVNTPYEFDSAQLDDILRTIAPTATVRCVRDAQSEFIEAMAQESCNLAPLHARGIHVFGLLHHLPVVKRYITAVRQSGLSSTIIKRNHTLFKTYLDDPVRMTSAVRGHTDAYQRAVLPAAFEKSEEWKRRAEGRGTARENSDRIVCARLWMNDQRVLEHQFLVLLRNKNGKWLNAPQLEELKLVDSYSDLCRQMTATLLQPAEVVDDSVMCFFEELRGVERNATEKAPKWKKLAWDNAKLQKIQKEFKEMLNSRHISSDTVLVLEEEGSLSSMHCDDPSAKDMTSMWLSSDSEEQPFFTSDEDSGVGMSSPMAVPSKRHATSRLLVPEKRRALSPDITIASSQDSDDFVCTPSVSRGRRHIILSDDEDDTFDSPDPISPTMPVDGDFPSDDEEFTQILQTMADQGQLP